VRLPGCFPTDKTNMRFRKFMHPVPCAGLPSGSLSGAGIMAETGMKSWKKDAPHRMRVHLKGRMMVCKSRHFLNFAIRAEGDETLCL